MEHHSQYDQLMADELYARGIETPAEQEGVAEKQRKDDLLTVSSTAEGRRVLGEFVNRHRNVGHAIHSDAALFALGLGKPGQELENELRRLLPREVFLEIVYPKET